MASKRMLRFGGASLGPENHTYYRTSKGGAEVRADHGVSVEFDQVVDAQRYVDTGLAEIVEPSSGRAQKEQ